MRSARYRARHRVRPQDPAMRESAHRAPALHPRWPWSPPFGSAPPKVSLPYGRDSGSAACSRCRSTRFLCVVGAFFQASMGYLRAGRRRKPMKVRTIVAAICAALAFAVAGPASAPGGQAETVTPKFDQAIPNIPGKSLVILEVDYAPGAASPPHTHAKSAFIYAYVISGAIHSISRNASKTEPAKLLAVFVLDTNDNPLTTTIK